MCPPATRSEFVRDRSTVNGSFGSRCRRGAGVVGGGCLVAFVLLKPSPARAQEALRNSLTSDAAAESRRIHPESLPYTFKSGDFRLLLVPSLGLDWNDNINIVKTNALEDFILRPRMEVDASYPISEYNLMTLNVGAGYDKYLDHDSYSTWYLQSGSQLSFDIYVKDFWFNIHDRVDYVQDTSQQPTLSGTATYATVNNTAGLSVTWDLNKATASTGYDHQNVISTTSQYNSENHASDMVFARTGLQVRPAVTVGIESTAAFTTYDQTDLNNNDAYTAGGYITWQPGQYFTVQPRAGYAMYLFQHTSQSIQTSDLYSWYADLNISHQVTDAIGYALDAGHEISLGIQSDAVEDWYVRPSVHWELTQNLSLRTSLSYQNGQEGVGNVSGNATEYFNWLSTSIELSYPIMKKLSLSVNYRMTLRTSTNASDEYTQNVVGIALSYRPHEL